jgi:hypothetical protein
VLTEMARERGALFVGKIELHLDKVPWGSHGFQHHLGSAVPRQGGQLVEEHPESLQKDNKISATRLPTARKFTGSRVKASCEFLRTCSGGETGSPRLTTCGCARRRDTAPEHLDGVDAPRRHRCAKVVVLSNPQRRRPWARLAR